MYRLKSCIVFSVLAIMITNGIASAAALEDTYIKVISSNPSTNPEATASQTGTIAIGSGASAERIMATALGSEAKGEGTLSTAIGSNAWSKGLNSVALGSDSRADENNTVSVGYDYTDTDGAVRQLYRRITNVADAVNDTDAVTLGQIQTGLKSLKVGDVKVSCSDSSITGIKKLSVGDDIKITESAITVGKVKINAEKSTITGLADGRVEADSTDAVNGGQLYKMQAQVDEGLERLDKNIGYVGAHAAAMSALHAVPYNGTNRTSITAGLGNYRGEQGYALGVFHYFNERVLANAAMSYNTGGDVMSRVGISFALGKDPAKNKVDLKTYDEMKNTIYELQKDNAKQQQIIQSLTERLERLERASETAKK